MILAKLLVVGLCCGVAHQTPNANFFVGGKHILLYNIEKTSGGFPKVAGQETHVLLSGDGAELRCLEMGLQAKGQTMEYRWAQIDPKTLRFASPTFRGTSLDLPG